MHMHITSATHAPSSVHALILVILPVRLEVVRPHPLHHDIPVLGVAVDEDDEPPRVVEAHR